MRTIAVLALFAPLATCTIYDITGSCDNSDIGLVCVITTSVVNPAKVCNGKAGAYAGDGINGMTSCTGIGSPCTYVWRC
ncbi:hypothetical protein BFJ69_g11749 [Fusarium oxysporum]|uniref:Secreted in xylem 14 n=1 Tax=Fusarium oxysporum TaxID=5507 RepID=A0A420MRF4_FUSOX|nr:hypothetical protein BFJ69_g11749 [Fusarium oxysporum]